MKRNLLTEFDAERICEGIKCIDLSCNKLKKVPLSLFHFEKLISLILTQNELEELPFELCQSKLEVLGIFNNPIRELSALPPSLQELWAYNCNIERFPECLFRVESLRLLNLACNRITEVSRFPEGLDSIDLSVNAIVEVPELPEFVCTVDLSHNKLLRFLMQSNHPHLQSLDLSHNAITQFTLDLLQSLKALKLSHNPDLSLKVKSGALPQNQHNRHIPDVHQIFVTITITANRRTRCK
jgi:Leucine-rich repeat (LRR) protein